MLVNCLDLHFDIFACQQNNSVMFHIFFSVTFKEDSPRKGFFALHLGMKEMTVNKVMLGLGKSTPKNAVIKPPVFTTE